MQTIQKKWCAENFQGQTFNQLTVLGPSETQSERSTKRKWLDVMCRCACGTVKSRPLQEVVKGNVKSCGCLSGQAVAKLKLDSQPAMSAAPRRRPATQAPAQPKVNVRPLMKLRYDDFTKKSRSRGMVNTLTFDQWMELVTAPCWYTGRPPERRQTSRGEITCHGLDRLDNTKGYTLDNVITSCSEVNVIRGNIKQATFLILCQILSGESRLPQDVQDALMDMGKIFLCQRAVRPSTEGNRKIPWEDIVSICQEVHAYRKSKVAALIPEIFAGESLHSS